jgi:hypothetical protein
MAFASLHTMDGDPDDLLARKRSSMDPVVDRLAPQHGALLSVTARTDNGLVVFNLWEDAEGATVFSQLPEVLAAQKASGLPGPSSFTRFPDAAVSEYARRPAD